MNSPVLKCVTMIDTPGILSGEKQRTDRGYDFVGVLQWFAERVDRIILLFDANKLDISDEFRRSIEAIHGYEDKVGQAAYYLKSDTVPKFARLSHPRRRPGAGHVEFTQLLDRN